MFGTPSRVAATVWTVTLWTVTFQVGKTRPNVETQGVTGKVEQLEILTTSKSSEPECVVAAATWARLGVPNSFLFSFINKL